MTSTRGTNRSPTDNSDKDVTPVGRGGGPDRRVASLKKPPSDDPYGDPPQSETEKVIIGRVASLKKPPPTYGTGPSPTGGPESHPESEETIVFHQDDEDPSQDDDEEPSSGDDERSEAPSVISLTYEGVTVGDLLDLTEQDGQEFCRVKMTRVLGKQRIPCVCGRPKGRCSRTRHSAKRTEAIPGTLGDPGFYEPLEEVNGADGRIDRRWFSTEEITAFTAQRRREQEETARLLDSDLAAAAGSAQGERGTAVSFGGVSYHGGAAPPGDSEDDRGSVVQGQDPDTNPDSEIVGPNPPPPPPPPPRHEPALMGEAPPPRDPRGGGNPLWYCLERPSTQRLATNDPERMLQWQSEGATLIKVVRTRREADDWVKAWQPPAAPDAFPRRPPTFDGRVNHLTGRHPDHLATTDGLGGPPGPTHGYQPDALNDMLVKATRFATGPDPSTGTNMIFGIDPADTGRMDDLLLPPHVEGAEARQDFYDLAMDVVNLPGGYRTTDDDDFGSTELLARAFGRGRTATFRNWRKITNNALGRVKSLKELLQLVKDVEKAVVRHRAAQEHRMRSFLHACGLPGDMVGLYLRSGLLPRLLQETYVFYHGLLETCRSAQWEMPSATWKDGYVDQMIRHHALELGQIRMTAADYRMHLLETYVYLRNANKEKYQDPSFTRSLLYSVAKLHSDPTTDPDRSDSTGQATNRCKHCRRKDTHTGTEKEDCPLKALSSRKAQAAVNNLNKNQAKSVAKRIKEQLESNPSGDVDAIIASARAAV